MVRWGTAVAAFAAVALIAPLPALADNNLGNIIQDGNTNSATILQTGNGNSAGGASNDIEQRGANNFLSLTQSGDDNDIGLVGVGLTQSGPLPLDNAYSNSATILQNSKGNSIGELWQSAYGPLATTSNVLSVTQDIGNDNTIRVIQQQVGAGASANSATIRQTGIGNWIERLDQLTTSAHGPNSVVVTITGNYNGLGVGANAAGSLKVLGQSAGAEVSVIRQGGEASGGSGNAVNLVITGDQNQFGITQLGRDNTVGGRTITGLGNSIGIYQLGHDNQVNGGAIVGDGNDLGIRQDGVGNEADSNMLLASSDNRVGVGQDGDSNKALANLTGSFNVIGLGQLGNYHIASVTIAGASNIVLGVQANGGLVASRGNELTVSVNGDRNNALDGTHPQSFAGVAFQALANAPNVPRSLLVAPDASLMLGQNMVLLVPGALVQNGEGNKVSITVGGTAPASDNLFSTLQQGNGSQITATVNGHHNQFVVLQVGNDDVAVLEQSGSYNIAAISQ